MQKLYIHSYLTFMDFGALNKHILKNIDDFLILTPFNIKYEYEYEYEYIFLS